MKRLIPCLIFLFVMTFVTAAPPGRCEPMWRPWTGPGDSLVLHQGPSEFKDGEFDGTHVSGRGVKLAAPSQKSRGYYLSPAVKLQYQADWVIPSWNILCPKDGGWLVEVRVRSCDGELSPWLYLGSEGIAAPEKGPGENCRWAKVDIDNIRLKKPVTEAQYRVSLQGRESSPTLKLFALAFRQGPPVPDSAIQVCRAGIMQSLPVPFRSQYAEEKDIASRICCPTSASMVLQFLGVNLPTAEIASRLYNKEHDLYGIWWRPPQLACQLGLRGWVRLFSSWEEVQRVVAEGQPIIASISYEKDELHNSPVSSSKGHLTVVTGFDSAGNVCVNDPAGRDAAAQPIHYDRVEYGKAWFLHGGVGIILRK